MAFDLRYDAAMAASGISKQIVTADDVRTVQFDRHRPGYHMEQVDQFLDLVADALENAVTEIESHRSTDEPKLQLYDPDGAAARLLAAAQSTIDKMVHEADTYATAQRTEADAYRAQLTSETDDYAGVTRSEADTYSTDVRGSADAHATAVRGAAAEEARRMAEEARSALVVEMRELESIRESLLADNEALQQYLDSERGRITEILESERGRINDILDDAHSTVSTADLQMLRAPQLSGASVDDHTFEPVGVVDEGPATQAVDALAYAEATDVQDNVHVGAHSSDDDTDDLAPPAGEPVVIADPPDIDLVVAGEAVEADDAMEAAARSVFDLDSPSEDVAVDVTDDELFASDDTIDLDAEPRWEDDSTGQRFLSELRDADVADDDGFGPLDDRTETAMSAFFSEDD